MTSSLGLGKHCRAIYTKRGHISRAEGKQGKPFVILCRFIRVPYSFGVTMACRRFNFFGYVLCSIITNVVENLEGYVLNDLISGSLIVMSCPASVAVVQSWYNNEAGHDTNEGLESSRWKWLIRGWTEGDSRIRMQAARWRRDRYAPARRLPRDNTYKSATTNILHIIPFLQDSCRVTAKTTHLLFVTSENMCQRPWLSPV